MLSTKLYNHPEYSTYDFDENVKNTSLENYSQILLESVYKSNLISKTRTRFS